MWVLISSTTKLNFRCTRKAHIYDSLFDIPMTEIFERQVETM